MTKSLSTKETETKTALIQGGEEILPNLCMKDNLNKDTEQSPPLLSISDLKEDYINHVKEKKNILSAIDNMVIELIRKHTGAEPKYNLMDKRIYLNDKELEDDDLLC